MKISEITNYIETTAPLAIQESYDNSGLIAGNRNWEATGALLTIDVTEAVIDEAIRKRVNLVIAHHPIVFSGLKKITGKNYVERTLIKAIKNDIAIYAAHTNLDNAANGVNHKIAEQLGLVNCQVLQPATGQLKKLVTYIPVEHAAKVQEAVFAAGAGHIGNYDSCGFSAEGSGTFRGNEKANPFVGEKGVVHSEKEIRFETVFQAWQQKKVIDALLSSHPYEEVAFDIFPLENSFNGIGSGIIGSLKEPADETIFLSKLKSVFKTGVIKHTTLLGKPVERVAICGGSGSFLLNNAIAAGASFFISADFKYHQFFDAENNIVIADIGHFESEQFTKELFYELLTKKFPKFAVHFTEVNTNPVFYF